MKRILFLLICCSFYSLKAQSTEEAIQFLKVYCHNWSCKPLAEGTLKDRLEISLIENNKWLKLKFQFDEVIGGYVVLTVDLSKINQINTEANSICTAIIIQTQPNGIEAEAFDRQGTVVKNVESFKAYFEKTGWAISDVLLIKTTSADSNGPLRIVNALKFLAEQQGAVIKKSSF